MSGVSCGSLVSPVSLGRLGAHCKLSGLVSGRVSGAVSAWEGRWSTELYYYYCYYCTYHNITFKSQCHAQHPATATPSRATRGNECVVRVPRRAPITGHKQTAHHEKVAHHPRNEKKHIASHAKGRTTHDRQCTLKRNWLSAN